MTRGYVAGRPPTLRQRMRRLGRAGRRAGLRSRTTLARLVAGRDDAQLERAPLGPIVLAALPLALRAQFNPAYAVDFDGTDIDGTLLVTITRRSGARSDRFAVRIAKRRCQIRRVRHAVPADGTLTVALADLVRMATAAVDPHRLSAEGKLAVAGDTFFVVRFPGMFRQPTDALV